MVPPLPAPASDGAVAGAGTHASPICEATPSHLSALSTPLVHNRSPPGVSVKHSIGTPLIEVHRHGLLREQPRLRSRDSHLHEVPIRLVLQGDTLRQRNDVLRNL